MHSPYRKGRKTGKHERRSILNAAAFQDHMARLVALPSGALGPVSTSGVERARPRGSRAGRHGAEEEEEETEAEVVGRGHRLTLAQMRGLVEAPRSKLDEYEWLQAHAESMRRGDVEHGCSICYEPFKGEDRVLLSCSHTFHRHCLASFERFTKQRCCPLCRSLQYQKRVVADAKEVYQDRCATVIQKHYRGRLARLEADRRRRMRVPDDEEGKKEWCAARLGEASGKLIERLEAEDDDIERLLADLDRKIFFSKNAREAASSSLREPRVDPATEAASAEARSGVATELRERKRRATDWGEVAAKARRRKDKTCPICIGPLERKLRGNVALLSCSHTFHEDCLCLFELFQIAEDAKPVCPLCRAEYEKKVVQCREL